MDKEITLEDQIKEQTQVVNDLLVAKQNTKNKLMELDSQLATKLEDLIKKKQLYYSCLLKIKDDKITSLEKQLEQSQNNGNDDDFREE